MMKLEDCSDTVSYAVITREMVEVEDELAKKTAEEEERLKKEMEVCLL
jgi:hypothetical protein